MKNEARQRSQLPTSKYPEVRLVVGGTHRLGGVLDLQVQDAPEPPSLDALVALAETLSTPDGLWLAGGEPTLRKDLPRLVQRLAGHAPLGMVTDGLALAAPKVATMLYDLGLRRVRVRMASARADAHDWAVGQAGAFKKAVRGLRAAREAGLEVEVEVPVTRPTRPYPVEAVELFARLGVSGVVLRRVTARGAAREVDVTVLARLAFVQRPIESAVQVGVRHGMRMMVEGFPVCAAPGVAANHVATDAIQWAIPDEGAWRYLKARFDLPAAEPGCATCPGSPACCQAPTDYLRRYGRDEIDSQGVRSVRPGALPATPLAGGDVKPPARAGRFPATRLGFVRRAVRMPSLSGDPLVTLRPEPVARRIRTLLVAPSEIGPAHLGDHPGPAAAESTRAARVRLVRLAQQGTPLLRLASAGTLAHPDAPELLRETTRLEFPRIEVAGDGAPLDRASDMQLRRLRGIHRVDLALFGPDAESHDAVAGREGAFEATLRVADRLATLVPSMEVATYAVLQDETHVEAFVEAWDFGDLPGQPWFRLASKGGSLRRLAAVAESLPDGAGRDALAAVLPVALLARGEIVPAPQQQVAAGDLVHAHALPSGIDRYGCYTDRPSGDRDAKPGDCPGYAVGWTVDD